MAFSPITNQLKDIPVLDRDKLLNAHGKRSTKNVFPYLWTREDIKIEFGLQIQFEIEGKKSQMWF